MASAGRCQQRVHHQLANDKSTSDRNGAILPSSDEFSTVKSLKNHARCWVVCTLVISEKLHVIIGILLGNDLLSTTGILPFNPSRTILPKGLEVWSTESFPNRLVVMNLQIGNLGREMMNQINRIQIYRAAKF